MVYNITPNKQHIGHGKHIMKSKPIDFQGKFHEMQIIQGD